MKLNVERKSFKILIDKGLVFLIVLIVQVNADNYGSKRFSNFDYYSTPFPFPEGFNLGKTYTFNDRRYGYYQPNQPNNNNIYQTNKGVLTGEEYLYNSPGVLAGWREDLQGKQRQDSISLDRDVFVDTNYGQVQGFKVYMYDNPDPKSFHRPYHSTVERVTGECSTFLGIPYAMPPTFEGRFKPPRSHRGWQIMRAVDFGPACPQPARYTGATKGILNMDEDCLYLNIFSPKTGAGVAQKYPVMIYIHGGDFIHGASNLFPAHIMASFYEVVVVTFNYRLGALGFLSTGDANSPGNYGMLDQAMAVRWVYDNIEAFNGNRDLITLFGPGAGAASAGLLLVAPQTKNIVKRVIAQSGSPLADWAMIQDKYRAQNTSRVFGQLMGCNIDSSWKLMNCLRTGRTFYEIGNAEFQPKIGMLPWGPILDTNITFPEDDWYEGWHKKDWKFISKHPKQLIEEGDFYKGLQYMTSVTTQEAAQLVLKNESLAPSYEIDQRFLDEKIREHVLLYNYTLNPNGSFEAIKYMYTYWPDPNNTEYIRDQYINMVSDYFYRAPVDQMVKLLLQQKIPTYMYVLNTTVESLNLPQWSKYSHDIEHYFLTGAPFMDVEFFPKKYHFKRSQWTDNDRNMSHFFLKTYTNFARYGNPTPEQVLGLHFEKVYPGELRYLNLNTTYNSTILKNYRQLECAFWTNYFPTVIKSIIPLYPPFMDFSWEPKEPLQIALWSLSITSFFLLILVVVCCIMWRNAKRQSDRYLEEDFFAKNEEMKLNDYQEGINNIQMLDNPNTSRHQITALSKLISNNEMIAIEDQKMQMKSSTGKAISQTSLHTISHKEVAMSVTPTPTPTPKAIDSKETWSDTRPNDFVMFSNHANHSPYHKKSQLDKNSDFEKEKLRKADKMEQMSVASNTTSSRSIGKLDNFDNFREVVPGVPQTSV